MSPWFGGMVPQGAETEMSPERGRRVAWVATSILPFEPGVRAWLARSGFPTDQADDFIQEAYCKLSALASVEHIKRPDAYFFQTVRSLVADSLRHARVIRIESVTEIDLLPVYSDEPSPEQALSARQELAQVLGLIAALPGRCREVLALRKIDGMSQKDIATRLGITETMVENDVVKGMRIISTALKSGNGSENASRRLRTNGPVRLRRRD